MKPETRMTLEWLNESVEKHRQTLGADPIMARITMTLIAALLADEHPGATPELDGLVNRYPWGRMALGQWFDVPLDETDSLSRRRRLTNISGAGIAWARRNAPDRRFSVRAMGDKIRVTRVDGTADHRVKVNGP